MLLVNADILRKETVQLLTAVNAEMKKYEDEAKMTGESPFDVPNQKHILGYSSLVSAKLSALNTLALLNVNAKR